MKDHHDVSSVEREFNVGDKVLLFLPIRKFPLQTRYQGPYDVIGKEGKLNYVISTPGRHKTKKVVHVNLLKEYRSEDVDQEDCHSANQVQLLCQCCA